VSRSLRAYEDFNNATQEMVSPIFGKNYDDFLTKSAQGALFSSLWATIYESS